MNKTERPQSDITLPWHRRIDWVTSGFLILTPIAAATLTPIYLIAHEMSWSLIALFVIYGGITNLAITAGYHRYLSHQSYQASPLLRLAYLLFGAAAFQGSALKWCSDHRRHHRFVDTDVDPYNIGRGFFFAHIGWLFLKDDPNFRGKFAVDLERDPMIQFQHKYYGPIAVLMGFGLPWLVGYLMGSPWGGFIFGGIVRTVVTHHTTFFINSACHVFGTQTYGKKNSARDSLIMAFFTHGEGYHNFHHHFQTDYRNGIRWYDWDPTKWFIRSVSFVGLATRLKKVSNYEIVRARLKEEERRLLSSGAPAARIEMLRQKVEESLQRWQQLKLEYKQMRVSAMSESRERMRQLKFEISQSKREFKLHMRAWIHTLKNPMTFAR